MEENIGVILTKGEAYGGRVLPGTFPLLLCPLLLKGFRERHRHEEEAGPQSAGVVLRVKFLW